MATFQYLVTIDTDTINHADEVMGQRLGFDEDYGFEYSNLDWSYWGKAEVL